MNRTLVSAGIASFVTAAASFGHAENGCPATSDNPSFRATLEITDAVQEHTLERARRNTQTVPTFTFILRGTLRVNGGDGTERVNAYITFSDSRRLDAPLIDRQNRIRLQYPIGSVSYIWELVSNTDHDYRYVWFECDTQGRRMGRIHIGPFTP
ncbi:hypothetical protein [Hyphobacterium sp.]|uniref:hypothetical protein n=1 Tax=Hyphobacterium sp. TaxID=2004662 RepID=UPI003BAD59B0